MIIKVTEGSIIKDFWRLFLGSVLDLRELERIRKEEWIGPRVRKEEPASDMNPKITSCGWC